MIQLKYCSLGVKQQSLTHQNPNSVFSDPAYKPPMPSDDVNKGDLPYGIKPEPTPESGYMYGQPVQPGGKQYFPWGRAFDR